ncbi:hypothetical protein C2S52_009930 [Perilla frutescens var. hirtella]|nr:hypothetical protein C2S52_009930 [Perilla frutescens var. hirtella]
MGRAKLNMELIKKEKSRNTTFKKRKEGLIRKLHEFTTLCDVNACMIIYGPNPGTEAEVWPKNPAQVGRIIDIFKNSKNKGTGIKTYGLRDFFHERERKIEEDVAKLRRRNLEVKFPSRPQLLDVATEPQLREFHALLSSKAHEVKSRIQLLRRYKNNVVSATTTSNTTTNSSFYSPLLEVINNNPSSESSGSKATPATNSNNNNVPLNMNLNLIDENRGEMQSHVNHNSSLSMMLLMNRNDQLSANIQLNRQVFFGAVDPMIPPPMSLPPWYYAAPPQHYMIPPAAAGPPQPYMQLHFSNPEHEDFIQYRIRNGHHTALD